MTGTDNAEKLEALKLCPIRQASEQVRRDAFDTMHHTTSRDLSARLMCRVDVKALALILAHHDGLMNVEPSAVVTEPQHEAHCHTQRWPADACTCVLTRPNAPAPDAYRAKIELDGTNPNNRRLIVNGTQWAKVYGFDPEMAAARAEIIAAALARQALGADQ